MSDQEIYEKFIEWLRTGFVEVPDADELLPMISARYTPEEAEFCTGMPFDGPFPRPGLEELAKEKNREEVLSLLSVLDSRIDKIALMAFDIYMDCRERLHQIRVNEVLSGRFALTDGTKCASAMLKQDQTESADNDQNDRLI